MKACSLRIIALLTFMGSAMLLPHHAKAAELSTTSSSGTITFTIIIPPFGASIAAARNGAVGLWTVAGANDGLMIKFDERADQPVLDLYRRPGFAARISVDGKSVDSPRLSSASTDPSLINDHYSFGGLAPGVNVITIAGI